jgi:hypothetical protein
MMGWKATSRLQASYPFLEVNDHLIRDGDGSLAKSDHAPQPRRPLNQREPPCVQIETGKEITRKKWAVYLSKAPMARRHHRQKGLHPLCEKQVGYLWLSMWLSVQGVPV